VSAYFEYYARDVPKLIEPVLSLFLARLQVLESN